MLSGEALLEPEPAAVPLCVVALALEPPEPEPEPEPEPDFAGVPVPPGPSAVMLPDPAGEVSVLGSVADGAPLPESVPEGSTPESEGGGAGNGTEAGVPRLVLAGSALVPVGATFVIVDAGSVLGNPVGAAGDPISVLVGAGLALEG